MKVAERLRGEDLDVFTFVEHIRKLTVNCLLQDFFPFCWGVGQDINVQCLCWGNAFPETDKEEKWESNPMYFSPEIGTAPAVLNHDHL